MTIPVAHRLLQAARLLLARPIPLDKGRVHELADVLARRIEQIAARRDPKEIVGRDAQMFEWDWKADAVRGSQLDVHGVTQAAPSASKALVISADVRDTDIMGGDLEGDVLLRVRLNGSLPWGAFTDTLGVLSNQLYSVLLHELTHVAESRYMHVTEKQTHPLHDPSLQGEDRAERLRDYYNSPHEVRAYLQQIIDETIGKAASFRRRVMPDAKPHDFIMALLGTSRRWKQISGHLTPQNEALILRAVYAALVDAEVLP